MNFWVGMIIGLIVGANIGVLVAGLLASLRRDEQSMDTMELQLTRESAVMDEDPECADPHRRAAGTSQSKDVGPQGAP
jgi:hypothetical protein